MSANTHRVNTPTTTNASTYTSGSFTPAANELLYAFIRVSGVVGVTPTFSDTQSLGWTLIGTVTNRTTADSTYFVVANALAANSSMTLTISGVTGGTGSIIDVNGLSGMSLTGVNAIRSIAGVKQLTLQSDHASGTPAPALPGSALTGNPTVGMVSNVTNPATMTPPTSWTENSDAGYATPTTGMETVSRDSGFTGTTITWGSASPAAFGCIVAEFTTQSAPTVALNTPANGGTAATTLPTLAFTGTDADSDDITYEIEIDTANTFNSQSGSPVSVLAEVRAGGGAGGGVASSATGGGSGGGGGAYSAQTGISVSNATGYTVTVGAAGAAVAGANGGDGGDSWFNTTGTVLAKGGGGGLLASATGGTGGAAASGVGTTKHSGAAGGAGSASVDAMGSGGGGAGTTADGSVGSNGTAATGGAGGSVGGGAGGDSNGTGQTGGAGGHTFGGGGSGGGNTGLSGATAGGAGGAGQVVITAPLGTIPSATGGTHTSDATNDYWTFSASGTWTPTITAPLYDKLSASDLGFLDITNVVDTDPFASGNQVGYTVQAGSPLTNGITYFWRVRGKDPSGSNTFGAWSSTFSFSDSTSTNPVGKDISNLNNSLGANVTQGINRSDSF